MNRNVINDPVSSQQAFQTMVKPKFKVPTFRELFAVPAKAPYT
jgi:hypothetical protein